MMTRKTTKKKAWWSKAMLVPAFAVAVFLFSTQSIANNSSNVVGGETPASSKLSEDSLIVPGKGVSAELQKEYQSIVNKYLLESSTKENVKWKNSPDGGDFDGGDFDRLYTIFVQMDTAQRKTQSLFFRGPYTPMIFLTPKVYAWDSFKRADILWFNGKKAEISILKKYKREDIYLFTTCYMDKDKKVYQVVLFTKNGYKTYMRQHKDGVTLSELLSIRPAIMRKSGRIFGKKGTIVVGYQNIRRK